MERILSNDVQRSTLLSNFLGAIPSVSTKPEICEPGRTASSYPVDSIPNPRFISQSTEDNSHIEAQLTSKSLPSSINTATHIESQLPPESVCLMLRSKRYRFRCSPSCLCVCHKRTSIKLPPMISTVLGNLFVGYSGLPFITPACDKGGCVRASASVDINYYFPITYFERVFKASVAVKTTGIAQSISVTRVRDWYCPLRQYTRDNEILGIQSLFDTSRASPYDVNIFGQSALHVNVIRSACRFPITNGAGKYPLETQKVDLCQFLIQQGADPYLQDNNGR